MRCLSHEHFHFYSCISSVFYFPKVCCHLKIKYTYKWNKWCLSFVAREKIINCLNHEFSKRNNTSVCKIYSGKIQDIQEKSFNFIDLLSVYSCKYPLTCLFFIEPNNNNFKKNFGHSSDFSLSDGLSICSNMFSNW